MFMRCVCISMHMTRPSEQQPRTAVSLFKNIVTVLICVSLFAVPVSAQFMMGPLNEGPQQSLNLDCLDESESEISNRLTTFANRALDILPTSVRNRVVNERVSIKVGSSTYFSAVVNEQTQIESVQAGQIEDPTLIAETDCETIERISSSDSPSVTLRRSISQGDITWRGVNPSSDAAVSYGSKGVQAYHIADNSEVGNVDDGTDGFTNGLSYS